MSRLGTLQPCRRSALFLCRHVWKGARKPSCSSAVSGRALVIPVPAELEGMREPVV